MHTETGHCVEPAPSPQASRCVNERTNVVHCEYYTHSVVLGGDAARSCSTCGCDLVAGGDEAADGGDVVDSAPSRAASALVHISICKSAVEVCRHT